MELQSGFSDGTMIMLIRSKEEKGLYAANAVERGLLRARQEGEEEDASAKPSWESIIALGAWTEAVATHLFI